jgi:putative membrane protein
MFVRPVFVVFTLPTTLLNIGLSIFVINVIIILLAAKFVNGFTVSDSFDAFFFRPILFSLFKEDKK